MDFIVPCMSLKIDKYKPIANAVNYINLMLNYLILENVNFVCSCYFLI